MPKGGHNRKPRRLHVIQGTFRPGRHAEHDTPEPPPGKPTPPRPLAGEALAEWDRMVGRLEISGTLSVVDDAALYQYVQLFAETEALAGEATRIRRLAADLRKAAQRLEGADLVAAIENIGKLHSLAARYGQQLRANRVALRVWCGEFGMTPASRSRVRTPEAKPLSRAEAFRAQKPAASHTQGPRIGGRGPGATGE